MKLFTSYFYQVRFFKPWQIPLSTAVYDPKWFHEGQGQHHVFVDKNGVVNGLRGEKLHPGKSCDGLCHGKPCEHSPESCQFLAEYRKQLSSIDKDAYLKELEALASRLKAAMKFNEEPEIMLIVHEAPTNACSERCVLQEIFGCNEWSKQ